ncbi:Uncharacterized membrane protein, DUF4010 family [Ectothiorhodospira mobilis]|uniref:Uncharacterized membrane protein, DUF4010 family n=1 Tax=Ectothiorhodospira mobilis TaxID=195064 RepID=A0A1I4RWL7_ECTMO|nr:MgtC/SapB family protein [Ectothiorhodospira mobilis]SFM56609.1 Uncharacterized membrane protein, DUF4010 family [Ectothiorhodospira mobilis]
MDDPAHLYTLALALALGLLIGLERGWKERLLEEGQRVAGIRTFALIGLLGGVAGLLTLDHGPLLLVLPLATLAAVLIAAHILSQRQDQDMGITGVVASLLTFCFGAMATLGMPRLAAACAVVTAILLGIKPVLHAWVRRLEERELYATFKMLLISVVILPLLPNQGYGPWEALNPHRIWWMVVLIAGISFVGYFAMRIVGERRGILATGLLGGLASSTAVTVNFARIARRNPAGSGVLAAGILVAGATMFPRMLAVTWVLNADLGRQLLAPVLVMMGLIYLGAALLWRDRGSVSSTGRAALHNPFELRPALIFAGLLVAIVLLSRGLSESFGDAGLYLLSLASGLADVDAITLSVADMTRDGLGLPTANLAILIAAFSNSLVKAGLSLGIGGLRLGIRVLLPMVLAVACGALTWWLTTPLVSATA